VCERRDLIPWFRRPEAQDETAAVIGGAPSKWQELRYGSRLMSNSRPAASTDAAIRFTGLRDALFAARDRMLHEFSAHANGSAMSVHAPTETCSQEMGTSDRGWTPDADRAPPTGWVWPFSTFGAVHQFGSDRRRTGLCAYIASPTLLTLLRHRLCIAAPQE